MLGAIQRLVGLRQQRIGLRDIAAVERDADADADAQLIALDRVGRRNDLDQLLGQCTGRGRIVSSACTMANSSPPRRATRSIWRVTACSRCATCCSSRSPAWCPRESLTSLKRSRSRYSTAKECAPRCEAANAWRKRSVKVMRLATPVSASVRASCAMRCLVLLAAQGAGQRRADALENRHLLAAPGGPTGLSLKADLSPVPLLEHHRDHHQAAEARAVEDRPHRLAGADASHRDRLARARVRVRTAPMPHRPLPARGDRGRHELQRAREQSSDTAAAGAAPGTDDRSVTMTRSIETSCAICGNTSGRTCVGEGAVRIRRILRVNVSMRPESAGAPTRSPCRSARTTSPALSSRPLVTIGERKLQCLRRTVLSAYADTTGLLVRIIWRRGWDSNPRAGFTRPSDFESAPL